MRLVHYLHRPLDEFEKGGADRTKLVGGEQFVEFYRREPEF